MADSRTAEVPASYEQFVEIYYDRILAQVRNFQSIVVSEAEDITQDIIMQFIAGGYLSIYSKDKQEQVAKERFERQLRQFEAGELTYKPKLCKGLFSSFVFEFVKVRLLGYRDRINKRQFVEGTEFVINTEVDDEQEVTITQFIGQIDNQYLNIELRDVLASVYRQLCYYTRPTMTRDLPELFTRIVSSAFYDNSFDRSQYAGEKQISISAVSMQLHDLRIYCEGFGLKTDIHNLFFQRSRQSKQASGR